MHAVARIALDRAIPNIQASWVKLGPDGAAAMLQAGANDLGGTLMDEIHHPFRWWRQRSGVRRHRHAQADGSAGPTAGRAEHAVS